MAFFYFYFYLFIYLFIYYHGDRRNAAYYVVLHIIISCSVARCFFFLSFLHFIIVIILLILRGSC